MYYTAILNNGNTIKISKEIGQSIFDRVTGEGAKKWQCYKDDGDLSLMINLEEVSAIVLTEKLNN